MNFYGQRFNLYFTVMLALALAGGCATNKKDKQTAALRVHIECSANTGTSGQIVSVLRANPVMVPITSEPVLTEANIVAATLLETPGGFAVEVKFNQSGAWMLEQYSAANPRKHFVIFGQWGEKISEGRWLAAPIITHRLANGILAFTPDASRNEATQLVLGLNNLAKKIAKAN